MPPGGPIEDAIANLSANFQQHHDRYESLPPAKKNLFRAGAGAGLITFCVYVAVELNQHGLSIAEMANVLRQLPNAPHIVWLPIAIWGTLLAFGLLWFLVGIRSGPRGGRDIMQAFWSLVLLAGWGALLRWEVYLPPDWPLANYALQGTYIAGIVGSLVRFWMSVRGTGMRARRLVEQQIQRTQVNWRTGQETGAGRGAGLTWRTGRQRQF